MIPVAAGSVYAASLLRYTPTKPGFADPWYFRSVKMVTLSTCSLVSHCSMRANDGKMSSSSPTEVGIVVVVADAATVGYDLHQLWMNTSSFVP